MCVCVPFTKHYLTVVPFAVVFLIFIIHTYQIMQLNRRKDQMKRALEQQQKDLQDKRKQFDEDKQMFEQEHQRYLEELEASMKTAAQNTTMNSGKKGDNKKEEKHKKKP